MKCSIALLMLFITLFTACQKIPPEQEVKEIKTKITDLKGAIVTEVAQTTMLRLSAPEFAELNKQGILKKEGYISFDDIKVKIQDAEDDYILTAVPIMNYIDSRFLNIRLIIGQQLNVYLCNLCILYRPTVSGRIFAGFTGGATDGTFLLPAEMAHDAAGNLYVIDQRTTLHDVILKITPAGVVSSFAGSGNEFGRLVGIGIDNSRNALYVSDATSQQVKSIPLTGSPVITVLAGSGSVGNTDGIGTSASFRFGTQAVDDFTTSEIGQGLALDASGNIFVGERYSSTLSSQIRRIGPDGVVTTVPGSLTIPSMSEDESAMPSGITVNTAGNLYTTSGSSGFFQGVNRFSSGASIVRLAGKDSFEGLNDGIGNDAQFSYPKALEVRDRELYVADGTNGALRRVNTSSRRVITLAGVGHFNTNRFSGSTTFLPPLEGSFLMENILLLPDPNYYETRAAAIRMDQVGGVAVISHNLIYVADYGYKCIWKITIS